MCNYSNERGKKGRKEKSWRGKEKQGKEESKDQSIPENVNSLLQKKSIYKE